MSNPILNHEQFADHWTVDVHTADHDEVKRGNYNQRVSRVHLSKEHFPNPVEAEEFAALMASSIRGGMPTRAQHCI